MAVQALATHLIWGAKMQASPEARAAVMALNERAEIVDWPLLRSSLAVLSLVLVAFVFAKPLVLEPGTIALTGAAVLMLLHNIEHHRELEKQTAKVTATFGEVDWITIFFFVGLFVVVHGLDATGVLSYLARRLVRATGGDFAL